MQIKAPGAEEHAAIGKRTATRGTPVQLGDVVCREQRGGPFKRHGGAGRVTSVLNRSLKDSLIAIHAPSTIRRHNVVDQRRHRQDRMSAIG